MMKDEGYIKFNCTWIEEGLESETIIEELNNWRQKLYNQQLIGAYPGGIGYGNISTRLMDDTFLITGAGTGNLKHLNDNHYTSVIGFDFDANTIICQGPIMASSESLTHAIIYETMPEVNAVVHIHHHVLWQKLLNTAPTTSAQVAYGTPEMANEIKRLLGAKNFRNRQILVMAGHADGLLAFGKDLVDAGSKIFDIYESNY
jgi:ribulose-5-phosphate 4-epimerase/fuculose-1-phosphate aldolase